MKTEDLFTAIAQIDSALYQLGITDVSDISASGYGERPRTVTVSVADFRRAFAGQTIDHRTGNAGIYQVETMSATVGDWVVQANIVGRADVGATTTITLPEAV